MDLQEWSKGKGKKKKNFSDYNRVNSWSQKLSFAVFKLVNMNFK